MAERRLWEQFENEESKFDPDDISLNLNKIKGEIIDIESKLDALKQNRIRVSIAKENDDTLRSLLRNEKKALKKLLQDIWKLPPAARKTLIEASIEEPIKIEMDYLPPDEIVTGKEWRFRWGENSGLNFHCLKGLVEKCILKQDSPK